MYLLSSESANAARIHELSLPVSPDWTPAAQLSALNFAIRAVCALVVGAERGGVAYVKEELTRRYEQLKSDPLVKCQFDASPVLRAEHCIDERTALTHEAISELSAMASRLASLFAKLPAGVRELVLLDWVEQRILWTVKAAQVPSYLRNCLPD
jgi:hypothetical protein